MAYRSNNYGQKKGKGKGKKYTEIEKLAYNYGRVTRGIKNPNSRVYESFVNGRDGKSTENKKPLF